MVMGAISGVWQKGDVQGRENKGVIFIFERRVVTKACCRDRP